MRFTLVVTSHGRWEYLGRALEALDRVVGLDFFDRRILSVDGDAGGAHLVLARDRHCTKAGNVVTVNYPGQTWEVLSQTRQGLTANLAQAWGALTPDDEWVFHLEEDFVIEDAPLTEMAETLDAFRNVANMVLLRQPWNQEEIRAGSILKTHRFMLTDMGGWLQHEAGFWLNPMLAHASLLRSLRPGVESDLTNQCKAWGLSFGYWGGRDDPPRCWHIGESGGMGSEGWLP